MLHDFWFFWIGRFKTSDGQKIPFQTTVRAAGSSKEARLRHSLNQPKSTHIAGTCKDIATGLKKNLCWLLATVAFALCSLQPLCTFFTRQPCALPVTVLACWWLLLMGMDDRISAQYHDISGPCALYRSGSPSESITRVALIFVLCASFSCYENSLEMQG